jgi:hypothetical protein
MRWLTLADLGDAIAFWERGRVIYNMAMFVVVYLVLATRMENPDQIGATLALWPTLLLWAVVANVLYCAAYPVELAAQITPLRALWREARWLVLAAGTLGAMLLASLAMVEVRLGYT